ncbi:MULTISPECIES: hypothetical protein [Streptomyces]|uniref:hypothetical protein n=1 Tax=Streptomyces TaxID=1883 RepID=UPI001163F7D4|nr:MULTISPECIES: hypothetical protein [Streptomyces]QDO06114.1 hypothetical protein FNV68_07375 [Streptomyces sp. S1D4-23]MCX4614859.1 hypothetical protein [Streptomyces mirabilis]NMI55566.1 hypothetical protein [Streptomyces sp. RLA2-12]QDN55069.1 hypothetical protein FNV67_06620 [Streptomyces sp. S1D4-20]QDN65248.1 hypothetical protein FNV66_06220 [Streptomyces sp. S1D4-14]
MAVCQDRRPGTEAVAIAVRQIRSPSTTSDSRSPEPATVRLNGQPFARTDNHTPKPVIVRQDRWPTSLRHRFAKTDDRAP